MNIVAGMTIIINDRQSAWHRCKAIVDLIYYDKRGEFSHCIATTEATQNKKATTMYLVKEQIILAVK